MEWKISIFFVCLLVTQVVSNCPDGCSCTSYYVNCLRSYLKAVPSDLPSNVQVLDLAVNEIRDLTRNSFSTTPDLEILLLNNNRITIISNGVFENLSKLRSLHIYKNKISTIEKEAFKNLENLKELYLHYNNIAQLDAGVFENLINLERLFLHFNTLIDVQMSVFEPLSNIKNLDLNDNPLNCNCEIFWLVESLRERNDVYISGTCNTPKSLQNESISNIKSDKFTECAGPRIIVQPSDVEIPERGLPSVTLRCLVRAYPKPRVSWEKDGIKLQSKEDKYELVPQGLIIKSVTSADVGKYQCIASNNVNTVGSVVAQLKNAPVKIASNIDNVPPHGIIAPTKAIMEEGQTVVITCTVSTKQSINLVWLRNNAIVSRNSINSEQVNGETLVSTLNLTDIRFEESGQYQCVFNGQPQIIFGSSEMIVKAAPKIIKHFDYLMIGNKSTTAELRCVAVGYPTPEITWFKNNKIISDAKISIQENGTVLKIENATEKDAGVYSCVAKNSFGFVEQKIEFRVQSQDLRAPEIIQKPFDISIPKFSDIIIPCKSDGNPQPSVQWLKNDESLIKDDLKFRIENNGSLRIFNASSADSGVYKCIASNTLGNDSASGTISIFLDLQINKIIDDAYIQQVVQEATLKVERAINATLDVITSKVKIDQSPGFLRSLFRFPDEYARNISKCREVFFIAVNLTDTYVRKSFNLSKGFEIRPEELFTPTQLNLIKKLSGCEASAAAANCSANMEFHSKYATLDGTCNNLKHPQWGASYTAFRRLLKPIYANGIDTPIAWKKELTYYGYPRPSPRLVSSTLIRTYNITPDTEITHLVMQWGQFMDHDLDHAPPSVTTQSFNGVKCSDTCEYDEPCYAIRIPANDSRHPEKSCFEFIRSTSILAIDDADNSNDLPYREQLNQPTAYIDGSMVYGFNKERSLQLRDLEPNLGLLRTGDKNYLPTARANLSEEVDCKLSTLVNDTRPNPGCYFAGDVRVNEMVGLLSMHTIWFREHNRLAKELKKINPHWDGDQVFYEARKILAAGLQHITYHHWLKHIIGPEGIEKLGPYKGYNASIRAAISNVFATAALRVGHTIINPVLVRLDHNYEIIPQGNLPLSKSFFAPWRLTLEGGVDPVVRGFYAMPAKRKYPKQNLNEQIIDHLFENRTGGAMDLAALNIQRSRDHGIPGYAAYRKFCGLSEPQNFDDLKSDISNDEVRDKLKELYGHPGNVDIWVGGILEDQRKGAIVGPLLQCLITEQFKTSRDGDRFWYENPTTFTPSQLAAIKEITLSRIFCDNGDNITTVTKDVFTLPSLQKSSYVPCDEIPKLDLKPWSSPAV